MNRKRVCSRAIHCASYIYLRLGFGCQVSQVQIYFLGLVLLVAVEEVVCQV